MPRSARAQQNAAATLELVARTAALMRDEARSSPTHWTAETRSTVADRAGTVAAEAIEAASDLIAAAVRADGLDPRDRRELAGAARDAAVVAGILIDKANLITGLATSRVERIDADELRRRLAVLLTVPASTSTPTAAVPELVEAQSIEAHEGPAPNP